MNVVKAIRKKMKGMVVEFDPVNTTIRLHLTEEINDRTLDDRLARLSKIKLELTEAVDAVSQLESEANTRVQEVHSLRAAVEKLEFNKVETEKIVNINEEVFSDILAKATKKGNILNLCYGFVLGCCASLLAAYIWENYLKA